MREAIFCYENDMAAFICLKFSNFLVLFKKKKISWIDLHPVQELKFLSFHLISCLTFIGVKINEKNLSRKYLVSSISTPFHTKLTINERKRDEALKSTET